MTINHGEKKSKLINYNKYASYLHLINCVSQIGLYYYLKKEAETDSRYEPYNIKITDVEYGLKGDWDDIETFRTNGIYPDLVSTVQNNFRDLRKREVTKYKIPLALVIASFSFMSFISHTALVILDNRYYSWIKDYKVNFVRWIEYFISSPTMMLAIAGLCEVNESGLLYNILISTAVTNVFGLMAEIIKDDPKYGFMSRIFYLIGFLPFRASWNPIISSFMKNTEAVKGGSNSIFAKGYKKIFGVASYNTNFTNNFQIPEFVKYTVYGLYGLYYLFPLNMSFQQYISNSENAYYNGELGYIALSFISKATLSWLVFSGTRRPNDDYFNNNSYSLIGGKLIKPKYIYYGLGGLGLTSLITSYYYRDNTKQESTKLKYDDNDVEKLYIELEEKGIRIDNLSDKELLKLLKKMKN